MIDLLKSDECIENATQTELQDVLAWLVKKQYKLTACTVKLLNGKLTCYGSEKDNPTQLLNLIPIYLSDRYYGF